MHANNLPLSFPSGLSIKRAKKKAKELVKKGEKPSLSVALNAISMQEVGLPWSKAVSHLKKSHPLYDQAIAKSKTNGDSFSIWLKGISTEIKIILSPDRNRGGYGFRRSHAIKTPEQRGPYHPSRLWGDDFDYALQQAISGFTQYYRIAVEKGHTPNEDWLIPY